MNEDEKIDRALDQAFIEKCIEREEPQGNGPWKWQLIRQLERIASALEGQNEKEWKRRIALGSTRALVRRSREDSSGNGDGIPPECGDPSALRQSLYKDIGILPDASRTKLTKRPAKTPVRHATQALIKSYCDAFKLRYGLNPPVDGKSAGLATNLLKTLPLERAILLVQAYIQMDERWFIEKCHDFPTFTQNITKVAVALFNGTNDPQEKSYWARIFGGSGDQGNISAAGEGAPGQLAQQTQPALSPATMDGATACK